MKLQNTILVVDDDSVDVQLIQRIFKRLKIDKGLEIAQDGTQALEYLEANQNALPCLILLDINMPRMNGLELLVKLKSHELYRMIPIVMLSTSCDQSDRMRSFQYSAAGYFLKSVDMQEFSDTLQSISHYWNKSELAA